MRIMHPKENLYGFPSILWDMNKQNSKIGRVRHDELRGEAKSMMPHISRPPILDFVA